MNTNANRNASGSANNNAVANRNCARTSDDPTTTDPFRENPSAA